MVWSSILENWWTMSRWWLHDKVMFEVDRFSRIIVYLINFKCWSILHGFKDIKINVFINYFVNLVVLRWINGFSYQTFYNFWREFENYLGDFAVIFLLEIRYCEERRFFFESVFCSFQIWSCSVPNRALSWRTAFQFTDTESFPSVIYNHLFRNVVQQLLSMSIPLQPSFLS